MDRKELRRRIAARPHAVRFAELEALLLAFGWTFDRPGKGDHLVYARGKERISIPYRRGKMLATYVRQVLELTEGEDDE
jgi:hypothetical protein